MVTLAAWPASTCDRSRAAASSFGALIQHLFDLGPEPLVEQRQERGARQVVGRQAEQQVGCAGAVDDGQLAVELEQQIGPAEGQFDETVALGLDPLRVLADASRSRLRHGFGHVPYLPIATALPFARAAAGRATGIKPV